MATSAIVVEGCGPPFQASARMSGVTAVRHAQAAELVAFLEGAGPEMRAVADDRRRDAVHDHDRADRVAREA